MAAHTGAMHQTVSGADRHCRRGAIDIGGDMTSAGNTGGRRSHNRGVMVRRQIGEV